MSDIVKRPTDDWVDVVGPVGELATNVARTPFVKKAMQGQPASVAAAILTGRELGLGPMASLRGIDVIEGQPRLTAEMTAARILSAGHAIEWLHSDDKACEVRITRRDGLSQAQVRYTMADAHRAGLDRKRNWQTDPRAMLRARALSNAARMACPDVVLGLDITQDMEQPPDAPGVGGGAVTVAVNQQPSAPARQEEPDPPEATLGESTDPGDEKGTVTAAQLRKLNAQVGQLERLHGDRLDRDQRRTLILDAADAGDLESAKDMSRNAASRAIEVLDGTIRKAMDADAQVVDAEVVEEPATETEE